MPIEVDTTERLTQLAEATLRVVEREGIGAITIRAVAAELGGSTAVVTNYLATRSDLLLNVIRHAQRGWRDDMTRAVEGLRGADLVRGLATWSCTTVGHDHAVRQLWLDMAAKAENGGAAHAALQEDAREHCEWLREAFEEAGAPDPDVAANLLYLTLRGFYFAGVEDPERWSPEHVKELVTRLCDLLLAGAPAPRGEQRSG